MANVRQLTESVPPRRTACAGRPSAANSGQTFRFRCVCVPVCSLAMNVPPARMQRATASAYSGVRIVVAASMMNFTRVHGRSATRSDGSISPGTRPVA